MYSVFFRPVTPPFSVISPHIFCPTLSLIQTYLHSGGYSDRTDVSVRTEYGKGWVYTPGPCVHPHSRCNVHCGHRYCEPDLHCSSSTLHCFPTACHDHGPCVHSDVSTTCMISNYNLRHSSSISECKHWSRDLPCSFLEIGCNSLSPLHGGVHVNASSHELTRLLSVIGCRLLFHPVNLGTHGPSGM